MDMSGTGSSESLPIFSRLVELNDQIRDGIWTPLILVRMPHTPGSYHVCRMDQAIFELPHLEAEASPSYYTHLSDQPSTWFRLTSIEPCGPDLCSLFTVTSSGSPLSSTLATSMASILFVTVDEKRLAGGASQPTSPDRPIRTSC